MQEAYRLPHSKCLLCWGGVPHPRSGGTLPRSGGTPSQVWGTLPRSRGTPSQVWGVPSPRSEGYPIPGVGVPHPRSRGYPVPGLGVPHPRSRGVPHPRSGGYPVPGLGGSPSWPGQRGTLGTPPIQTWDGVPPPSQTWDGVPPPTSVDRHTDSCQDITFPRTTYTGSKNTGKKFVTQGKLRENTGNFISAGMWPPCYVFPCCQSSVEIR